MEAKYNCTSEWSFHIVLEKVIVLIFEWETTVFVHRHRQIYRANDTTTVFMRKLLVTLPFPYICLAADVKQSAQ